MSPDVLLAMSPAAQGPVVRRGHTAQVQVLVDGTNSNTAGIVSNYIAQAIGAYAGAVQVDQRNARVMARTEKNWAARSTVRIRRATQRSRAWSPRRAATCIRVVAQDVSVVSHPEVDVFIAVRIPDL